MEDLRLLNDATRRNGIWYLQIRIPAKLRAAYGGKDFIRESLRTPKRSEAAAMVQEKAPKVRAEFDQKLAEIEQLERPKADLPPLSLAEIAQSHGREIADRELTALVDLYERACDDPKAFWRGEFASLPTSDHMDRLRAEGDLDRITGYVVRHRREGRIADLRRMLTTGDINEMMVLALAKAPGIDRAKQVALAKALARSEVAALESSLSDTGSFVEGHHPGLGVSASIPSPTPSILPPVSLDSLFDKWKAETKPSAKTLSSWRGVVKALKAKFPNKAEDAGSLTTEDMIAFKDGLVVEGPKGKPLSAKSINDSYLACIRTLYNYGMNNRLVQSNPAEKVKAAGKKSPGETRVGYTNDAARRLLNLAKNESDPKLRWAPVAGGADRFAYWRGCAALGSLRQKGRGHLVS